mmetsp:Transcript_114348/g.197727  ORF Transcript_114348/g.197727 Transcript_114348/m.197727 type:complete len:124 (-) Transcript_114348:115-486(-)
MGMPVVPHLHPKNNLLPILYRAAFMQTSPEHLFLTFSGAKLGESLRPSNWCNRPLGECVLSAEDLIHASMIRQTARATALVVGLSTWLKVKVLHLTAQRRGSVQTTEFSPMGESVRAQSLLHR